MRTCWLLSPAFLRAVPAQLFAHLSLLQRQHDFNASEQLNHHGDITYRWHACCGEPWWMRNLPLWNNRRSPGVIRESWCGRLEERTSLMSAGIWQSAGVWDARETLERQSSATFTWIQHGLPGAMASEVVCGLVFRLLLPLCLAAGEFFLKSPLFTHLNWPFLLCVWQVGLGDWSLK